jgi:putative transposase
VLARNGHFYRQVQRVEQPRQLRFLTFSCFGRLPLFSNPAIRDLFADRLLTLRERRGFDLIAWVVMPEHVHALLAPNEGDTVRAILSTLKGPFSQRVVTRWRELDAPILAEIAGPRGRLHFWQPGGGYDRNVFTDDERHEKTSYIHRNPVTRGLVSAPAEWKWSSLGWGRSGESPPRQDPGVAGP